MSTAWLTVGLLAVGTLAMKAFGPLALGTRELPARLAGVVALLAPSLLAALVVVDTFSNDGKLLLDARAAGLVAAAIAIAARAPILVVIIAAAAVTAALRAVT